MTTTSSKNFVGLYSTGTGTVNPNSAYGNANVVSLLAASTDGANTIGEISATGNIVTDAYFIGDGSLITNLPIASYGNSNVSAYLASGTNTANIITTGNVQGSYIKGDGSQLTNLPVQPGTYGNSNVATFLANFGSNTVVTTGNITGGYFLGNGSQLTGLPATYSNADVSTYLASGTNTANITTSGNINGSNLYATGVVSAVGNVRGGNINTAGLVTATGNVYGAFIVGDGSALTNLPVQPGTYSNSNVTSLMAAFGSNTISTTGNITGGYFLGNGSQLTGITTGYGNSNVATFLANFGSNTISTTGSINSGEISSTGNISTGNLKTLHVGTVAITNNNGSPATLSITADQVSFSGVISAAGNITGGNISTAGALTAASYSAPGNITGGNILTGGLISAAGSITSGGNLTIAAPGKIQFGTSTANIYLTNISPTTLQMNAGETDFGGNVVVTGFITASNIISSAGNILSGQQTIIGTANTTGGTGNIVISGKNIATDMLRNPDGQTASTADAGRILLGAGYAGNVSPQAGPGATSGLGSARLAIFDTVNRGNTALADRGLFVQENAILTANVTNSNFRSGGAFINYNLGGGSAANTLNTGTGFSATTLFSTMNIGGGTANISYIGNTTAAAAVNMVASTTVNAGSTLTLNVLNQAVLTHTGTGTNVVGYGTSLGGAGTLSAGGNVVGFYHPPVSGGITGATGNIMRNQTNYYAFLNGDPVAQTGLGSLRSYTDFSYTSNPTSGAITISKTNGQVQEIDLTGNITSVDFSNFVTSASTNSLTKEQADTVTVVFNQGATGGYGVTLPTGNAAIKYASGNSTVSTTANSVTMMSVTGIRLAGTTTYLVAVSPGFV